MTNEEFPNDEISNLQSPILFMTPDHSLRGRPGARCAGDGLERDASSHGDP